MVNPALIQSRRPGMAFRGRAPQITACALSSEKFAPQAKIVPQNIVTGPVPLECISGPEPPQSSACAPQA